MKVQVVDTVDARFKFEAVESRKNDGSRNRSHAGLSMQTV